MEVLTIAKGYEQIHPIPGDTIERTVNELLSCKKEGKLAYVKFNGVTLLSDTVTMDKAYKEITGKTKDELEILLQGKLGNTF